MCNYTFYVSLNFYCTDLLRISLEVPLIHPSIVLNLSYMSTMHYGVVTIVELYGPAALGLDCAVICKRVFETMFFFF
jgi:hypothetical protein